MTKLIRKILLNHLNALKQGFTTVYETLSTRPSLPYQTVYLQQTQATTGAISTRPHAEKHGYLQITLYVKANQGTADVDEQADRLTQHFYGFSHIEQGWQIMIDSPPLVGGLYAENGVMACPITIYFTAYEL